MGTPVGFSRTPASAPGDCVPHLWHNGAKRLYCEEVSHGCCIGSDAIPFGKD
jgi:hypothetical protein